MPARTIKSEKLLLADAGRAVRVIDIAREVGVSPRVVSKVLFPNSSNSARVGKETARRVLEVAQKLGYTPNLTAKQLAGARSNLIGVLIHSFVAEVSIDVLSFLELHASKQGYRLLIGQLHGEVDLTQRFIHDFAGRKLDGVICFVHESPVIRDHLQDLFKPLSNILFVGPPNVPEHDWVSADLAGGVSKIVHHLHETGRRRIALVQPYSVMEAYSERILGFRAALDDLGLSEADCPIWQFDPGLAVVTQQEHVAQSLEALLKAHPEIDGVVAVNDLAAMYAIQYLCDNGVQIPEQIAVSGFDDLPMAKAARPPITSINQQPEELALQVIELLCKRINDPHRPPESILIPPSLSIRKSTAEKP